MENIGNRIAKLRKAKAMTQEDLAEKMGVSSQAVSKWENNVSCPDISLLPQLAHLLGVSTDELLTGENHDVKVVPAAERKNLDELTVRIRCQSADGDRVRVNLPISLVKVGMELGMDMTPNIHGSDALRNMDWAKIIDLVEKGMIGKIVDIESADGDIIEVVVE